MEDLTFLSKFVAVGACGIGAFLLGWHAGINTILVPPGWRRVLFKYTEDGPVLKVFEAGEHTGLWAWSSWGYGPFCAFGHKECVPAPGAVREFKFRMGKRTVSSWLRFLPWTAEDILPYQNVDFAFEIQLLMQRWCTENELSETNLVVLNERLTRFFVQVETVSTYEV